MAVILKTFEEIEKIKAAGKILASVAKAVINKAKEGVSLKELDVLTNKLILKAGSKPAFFGYRPYGAKKPYPCSICASVNEVVVHGIPGNYKLKSGDLLKLDFGVIYDGYYADAAWTIGVGEISPVAKKLIMVTQEALRRAIQECRPGKTLGDVGYAVSSFVKKNGFQTVKGLTGHGIGRELHEDPSVFNEGRKGSGLELKSGMVLALEPMVSVGSPEVIQGPDDSYRTADGSLSAHFEHTVVITKKGPEILTLL